MKKNEKIIVECYIGESPDIFNPKKVRSMMGVTDLYKNGSRIALYEEISPLEEKEQAYKKLRREIRKQAKEYGIPVESLKFEYYDD